MRLKCGGWLFVFLQIVLANSPGTVASKATGMQYQLQRGSRGSLRSSGDRRHRGRYQPTFVDVLYGSDENAPDEQRLLSALLSRYEPATRPVHNASDVVLVHFGLTLAQISDMDEVNQILTTNVWLEQEWKDDRLRWNPADYSGLEMLRVPCERLWLPDIVLYNSADDFTGGFMQSKAMVQYDGNVFWPPPAKLRSSCKIDITYFPFDDQSCLMKFGSWTYDGFQVDVTNRSSFVDLTHYVYSGEWQLLHISVKRNEMRYTCCVEPYPDVTFALVIRRRSLYYLFNIICPCLWLTVLSVTGFWLPTESGEKVTLGITVLLAFSVFMLLIAESTPATSEFVPLIGIHLTVTMTLTSLSIMLTVFILQLHHAGPSHRRRVPTWARQLFVHRLGPALGVRHHAAATRCRPVPTAATSRWAANSVDPDVAGYLPLTVRPARADILEDSVRTGYRSQGRAAASGGLISRHLQVCLGRHCAEQEFEDIIMEWRLVAQVIDRLMFWFFLAGSGLSTFVILVILPQTKPDILQSLAARQ